ncbi:hypothetical protein GCM10007989_09930 [Devosia pacifica]|uniref:CN hydrolase domain-containing protein n=1 Tax=Devosia pacifica TaxID=1335967 RepID=A0A918VQI8_9HYPH|nr:carbon-nitrogen hydrolase family protein [Devosia pacifica]GHA16796.1 hypothetical protein GCM10007989_09930 [Devosia pacifica]
MKLASAQIPLTPDIARNAAEIRRVILAAAEDGARLILFCEGALSGYVKNQILEPDRWDAFDWTLQDQELAAIADLCKSLSVSAAIGGVHRFAPSARPHNCLYIVSADRDLRARYDKRFLSHTEITDWFTPGTEPVCFEVDGFVFGCAICIEVQFPELFMQYEQLGVDAVLFASYGIPEQFQIALRAHASLNCLWIAAATPAQESPKGPAGIIGPDGNWAARCPAGNIATYTIATLDRGDPKYQIPLQKARPWRALARKGEIYRRSIGDDEAAPSA